MAEAMRAARRLGAPCSPGWVVVAALWSVSRAAAAAAAPVTDTSTAAKSGPTPTSTPADTREEDQVGAGGDSNDGDDNVPVIARAGLEVDTGAAGTAGPVMLSRLEELGNLELRRAEILPRRVGDDPVIHLKVEVRGQEGDTYAIFSEVRVRDKVVEGSTREVVCSLCTEGEAVERARSELLRLVPFVRARFRAATRPKEDKPAPIIAPPPDNRPGTYGKAGIGLLAGGTLVFGTGLALALIEPRPDPHDPLRVIDTHPPGYAMLGIGAAAIVSGAVLLALDRRKVRRVSHLAPMIQRGSAGLLLVGRF